MYSRFADLKMICASAHGTACLGNIFSAIFNPFFDIIPHRSTSYTSIVLLYVEKRKNITPIPTSRCSFSFESIRKQIALETKYN